MKSMLEFLEFTHFRLISAKEQHDNFLGKVFTHFSKTKARFVREATYGIQATAARILPRLHALLSAKSRRLRLELRLAL